MSDLRDSQTLNKNETNIWCNEQFIMAARDTVVPLWVIQHNLASHDAPCQQAGDGSIRVTLKAGRGVPSAPLRPPTTVH